jgi:hypothetical protein
MTANEEDLGSRLYGRKRLIDQLSRSRAAVTLLVGDSGIGKSAVLAAAQQQSRQQGIAPPPRTMTRGGAVLQNALLQILADAVAEIISADGNAKHAASLLSVAAEKLAEDRGQELAKALGKEILNLVRGRLGDAVGDSLGAYIANLKTAFDEQLSSRISAAIDPGVVGLLIGLAAEVSNLAGDRDILLALDSGERLRDDDVRVLADLADTLPDGIRLRVAISTHDSRQRQKADYVAAESDAVALIEVEPLGSAAIDEWLSDAEIDSGLSRDVARLSGGYALHLGDLIAHLRLGGTIEEAPLNEQFAKRTREAWSGLDAATAASARAISLFADPLPVERLERYLSMTPHERGEFEDRLVAARIFSIEVNGQRWFHEQRRLFVVDEILDAQERASASAAAAQEIFQMYLDGIDPPRFTELAKLVAAAPDLTEADPKLDAVTRLGRDAVAVAASLIELMDPAAPHPVVGGDELLTYAMTVFGARGDLVSAVQELKDRELLVIVEDQGRTAVVPFGWVALVGATVSGRAEIEFGRRPIPSVGSAVFELEIKPRLGRFRKALYAFGRPSFETLSKEAKSLSEPAGDLIVIGETMDPALLLRVSHAARPMNVVATFASVEGRDEAGSKLESLSTEVLGEDLAVTDALRLPVPIVPSRRLVSALARILPGNLGPTPRLELTKEMSPTTEIERRAEALARIRGMCSGVEAQAMQIESPTGIAWYSLGDAIFEVEVRGGREGSEELEALPQFDWNSPFAAFYLAHQLGLEPGEWIAQQHFRSSGRRVTTDPVVETVSLLTKRASSFNQAQPGHRFVRLEDADLRAALRKAAQRELEDAEALASLPIEADLKTPVPRKLYLAVVRRERAGGDRYFNPMVVWAAIPSDDGSQGVEVAFLDDSGLMTPVEVMQETFEVDLHEAQDGAWGVPDAVLAPLLGYDAEDIRLCW